MLSKGGIASPRDTTKRIDQLDGVRAVAILSVFLHHAFKIRMLWAGVDLFFVLSGFLITGVLLRMKDRSAGRFFGHFYKRRALRILPPYALLLLLVTLVYGLGWAAHKCLYLFFLMNYMVAARIPHLEGLGVLWSLAVEEQFYLVWPFVIYLFSERSVGRIAAVLVVLAPLLRWFCTPLFPNYWPIYVMTPFRMDLLAVGALLSIVWRNRLEWIRRYGHYGLALSGFAAVVLLGLSRHAGFSTTSNTRLANVWIYELTLLAATGVIAWALSGRFVGVLVAAPVRFLGRISYTVYLINLLVLEFFRPYLPNPLVCAVVSTILIVAYATASWFLLERPLIGSQPQPSPVPIRS